MEKRGNRFINLTGQKFNMLTIVSFAGFDNGHRSRWNCKCECGNDKIITGYDIKSGHSVSCGCFARMKVKNKMTTHGLRKHPLYNIWAGMKQRCNNFNSLAYKNYGGRGIKICKEWDDSFKNFYNWAIKNGYNDNLTIERINNDDGYNPNNCKFIPFEDQAKNKRSSKIWIIKGKIFYNHMDAAKFFNVVRSTIIGWCYGYKPRNMKPRNDCFTLNVYPKNHRAEMSLI